MILSKNVFRESQEFFESIKGAVSVSLLTLFPKIKNMSLHVFHM